MAPVPNVSPATGKPVPDHYLHSSSAFFQDTNGRSILLRGVNLSGSAKAPVGQPSHSSKGFWEDAEAGKVDITSRPLNLEDGSADIHLARLRAWGYNFIRFVFTWEALEHKGPGKYDEEYIEYVVKALYKCQEWGFRVFMDPHQDVWSRFTGGSGAPLWTLYACGIDPMNITPTYSALVQCEWPNRENARPQDFPAMIWATNYSRLANQTLWTLFFAGRAYAPKCIIDGVNIQDYLQNHFINAVGHLAERLAKEDLFDNVIIGWDGINEPGDGLIGRENLSVMPEDQKLKKGPSPTPFQGMILGMGGKVEADDWTFTSMGPKNNGKVVMDSAGTKLWLAQDQEATRGGGKWGWKRSPDWQMGTCIWAQHGVWEPSTSSLIKPDYFKYSPESATKQTDMLEFWRTHYLAYATLIRKHHPESIHFIQPPVFAVPPSLPESFLAKRACTSPHYYDGLTLMTKHWNWFNADALGLLRGKYWSVVQAIKIGESAIRRCIQDQLGILKQDTRDIYGEYPTVLGEIGCPYDMDDKKAYGFVNGGKGEGDYSAQQKAWDASMNALDGPNCLNYTLWTYVPDNSHQWGDLWNGEDLSIWSADDAKKADLFVDNGNGKSENGKSDGATTSVRSVNGSPKTIAPSPSTASSTTLVSTGANQAYTRENIEQGDGVTAKLILEGSRAIGAVCRPYPIAVVGTPERIDFDIASSEFKLLIKVRANDSVPQGVVTEVYLPFVHYAQSLAPYSSTNLDNASTSTSNASSSLRKDIGSSAATPTTSAAPLRLDVDIDTSIGQVEIQGQMLRWTYPIPQSGEQYYSLKVKRRGGAIKREVGYVQSGGWADVCGSCVIC